MSPGAERAIERDLPTAVAAAVDFLYGPPAERPHRVGEQLRAQVEGYWSARRGQCRVIYCIHGDLVLVRVACVVHCADAYG